MLLTADTLLTGRELLRPGWIEVSDGAVQAVGAGAPPRPADHDLGAVTVVPGFVDTHLHGGGGANFSTALPAETATAAALHRAHGSTTVVASLVTAGPVELLRQVAALAARGHSDTSIARRLAISARTVQTHLARVYAKLGISSRAEIGTHLDP